MRKTIAALISLVLVSSAALAVSLNGAGATFPYPIYSKWVSVYKQETGTQINYAPIGSGGGIRQFTQGVVDFGGTDAYMSDSEISKVGDDVLHVPTVMGAVAVAHNAGISALRLDGETLAAIFMGEIKKWNDPRIEALNPGANLPDKSILTVHRSDSSGTTDIFTNYLGKVSTKWAANVGAGKSVAWPVGVGAKGNPGVAGAIKNNNGSIGYVELAYAETNDLSVAAIKNRSGVYTKPSVNGTTAAAKAGLKKFPADFRGEILNQSGPDVYPISGLTWLIVRKNQADPEKGQALKEFLKWAVTDGQQYAADLYYSPLPEAFADKVLKSIGSIVVK